MPEPTNVAPAAPPLPPPAPASREAGIQDFNDLDSMPDNALGVLFGEAKTIAPVAQPASAPPVAGVAQPVPDPTDPPPPEGSVVDPHAYTPPVQPTEPAPAPAPVAPVAPVVAPVAPPAAPTPTAPVLTAEEITALQELKTKTESEDFKNAQTIAEALIADPVGTVETYFPEIQTAIAQKLGIAQADDVTTYAKTYAATKLKEKYGEEFKLEPGDVNYPGTQSYEFRNDEVLYLGEGQREYNEAQQTAKAEAAAQGQQSLKLAGEALVKRGVDPQKVAQALEKVNSIKNTPEAYFAMVATYAESEGLLAEFKAAGHAGAQTITAPIGAHQSVTDALPPASVQAVPGATSVGEGSSEQMARFTETFPADMLTEDLL